MDKDRERGRKQALGYYYTHRAAVLDRSRQRYLNDPEYREKIKAQARRRSKHKFASDPHFRAKQLERLAAVKAKYGSKPRGSRRRSPATREAMKAAARNQWRVLKAKIFESYGCRCVCCGITEARFLTVDHIQRDGGQHRRLLSPGRGRRGSWKIYADIVRQGCPKDRYRILCMNCNWATRMGKPCPHEDQRTAMA